jgi:hypothetical protein
VWRIIITNTISGAFVDELIPAEQPTFTVEVNTKGSWGTTLALGSPPNTVDNVLAYATGGKHTWTVVWDSYPVQGGSPTDVSYEQAKRTLTVSGPGLGAFFEQREVRNPGGSPATINATANTRTITGYSRRQIMRQLVVDSCAPTGNALPLDVSDGLAEGGTENRVYNGFDFAAVWKKITEEAEALNGPEFVFRPYLLTVGTANYVAFKFALGTPLLGNQTMNALWESNSAFGVIDVDFNAGVFRPHNVWAKGAGDAGAAAIGYATNSTALVAGGYPYASRMNTEHADETKTATLDSYAASDLAEFAVALSTWRMKIRIDGRTTAGAVVSPQLGEFAEGDQPLIRVTRHDVIADGTYRRRILGYTNSDPGTVELKLAPTPGP